VLIYVLIYAHPRTLHTAYHMLLSKSNLPSLPLRAFPFPQGQACVVYIPSPHRIEPLSAQMSAYNNIQLDLFSKLKCFMKIYLAIFMNKSSIPELRLLGIVLMLSFALLTALSSFSEPKLEVFGALAGVLRPVAFSAPLGMAKGSCVGGGKLT
jgi:hypothetical protein